MPAGEGTLFHPGVLLLQYHLYVKSSFHQWEKLFHSFFFFKVWKKLIIFFLFFFPFLHLSTTTSLSCCCSAAQVCPILCDPTDCSSPGFPVPHHLPKFAQVHVHCISDAIQPSHPLIPSSSALNLSQHQGLFQ